MSHCEPYSRCVSFLSKIAEGIFMDRLAKSIWWVRLLIALELDHLSVSDGGNARPSLNDPETI